MADDRAPEAPPVEQVEQQQPGVQVDTQFVIQALQAKVGTLTNDLIMAEAYMNQQQAVIQQLAQQIADLQGEAAVIPMPEHAGRVTKASKKAAKG